MKKPKRITVILYGICSITGILNVIFDVVDKKYDHSPFVFILNVLAALLWIAAFVVTILKHRSEKDG